MDISRDIGLSLAILYIQRGPETARDGRRVPLTSNLILLFGTVSLFIFARVWLIFVSRIVPKPYLDEVFHIPQSQKYCEGKWVEWDDKITTPPGLYVIGVIQHKIWRIAQCSTLSLRSLNNTAILQMALVTSMCRTLIERGLGGSGQSYSFHAFHTAINIVLFPVTFFFSSLYYTDVYSTLIVLVCYRNHLVRVSQSRPSIWSDSWTILLSVAALTMRQTNIFWVVIYMGGMEAVHAVKALKPAKTKTPHFMTLSHLVRFHGERYALGDIHDPPLVLAWPDDWVLSLLSVAIAAALNPARLLRQVWPYIAVMGLFASFVLWNGGVVLGDKSNHIATLHLPQMLYIWPLFMFFSAPLFLPWIVSIAGMARNTWSHNLVLKSNITSDMPKTKSGRYRRAEVLQEKNDATTARRSASPATQGKSTMLKAAENLIGNRWYYPLYAAGYLLLFFVIVQYNTIIHPFTLADNRHYMFYVFRYTILRPGWRRYFLVPIYAICSRLCWQLLFGCDSGVWGLKRTDDCTMNRRSLGPQAEHIRTPFASSKMAALTRRNEDSKAKPVDPKSGSVILGTLDEPTSTSASCTPTTTALLWFIATTLSLMTAPLVEPRYFILPWVFWRLLVPSWSAHECIPHDKPDSRLDRIRGLGWFFNIGKRYDLRLVLETVWFLLINLGTMYIFLYRPFYWRAPDGSLLDDGRVQRFMW